MYLSNGQVVLNPSSVVDVLTRHVQSPGGTEKNHVEHVLHQDCIPIVQ